MIYPKVKDLFWEVVRECLVKFHEFKTVDAYEKSEELRARIEQPPTGMSSEIFYHSEPFDVACDIAEKQLDLKQYYEEYEALLIKSKWPEPVMKSAV